MGIRKVIYESSMAVRCYEYLRGFCESVECEECPFDNGDFPFDCLLESVCGVGYPKDWPECIICDRPNKK